MKSVDMLGKAMGGFAFSCAASHWTMVGVGHREKRADVSLGQDGLGNFWKFQKNFILLRSHFSPHSHLSLNQ